MSAALLLTLSACWWQARPGPAPMDEAAGPVSVVARPASGPATDLVVAVRAGSAYDPVGREGLAWLTAKLLREGGAGERTPAQVDAAIEALGTDVQVVIDDELVTFRTRGLNEDLPTLTGLLGDMLLAPTLDPAAFERLRGESLDWLQRGILANDEVLGMAALDSWLFQGHPYGHPVRGRAGVLPTLTVQDVRDFIDDRYVKPAITLGIAGPAAQDDPAAPVDVAAPGGEALLGLWERLSRTLPARLWHDVTPRAVPPVSGRSLLIIEKPTEATGVHFGHVNDLTRADPDWPAMMLAFTALGEHRQGHGRLYRTLRGERGLNYGDYAYIERYRQGGGGSLQQTGTGRVQNPFYVWLRPVTPANGPFATKAALSLIEDFARDGLQPDEFARIQRYLAARVALWASSNGRRLGWAVEARAMGWPDPIDDLPARVRALTLDQVNAAIQRHIHPDDLRIVVVTADGAAFRDAITEGTPTPIVYGTTPPAADSPQSVQDAAWAGYDARIAHTEILSAEGLFQ